MDRACRADLGRDRRGRALRRIAAAGILLAACTELTGDFSDVVAIAYGGPTAFALQEAETRQLVAYAIDLRGDTLPEVSVVWTILELDTVAVGITLDSLSGVVTAVSPGGPWRIQGRVESLRIDPPLRVSVTAAPDSMAAVEPSRLTVAADQDQSGPITTAVFDLTTAPDQETPLSGVPVRYRLIAPDPDSAAAATLELVAAGDTGSDPHVVTTLTGASERQRKRSRPRPVTCD